MRLDLKHQKIERKAGKSYSDVAAALWNEIENLE